MFTHFLNDLFKNLAAIQTPKLQRNLLIFSKLTNAIIIMSESFSPFISIIYTQF